MENNNLTLGSLFSGSGGFELGGLISGITPLWASEIEPFPIRVTTKRMPGETLRRCVCHQWSRPAARGHYHLWQSLSGYVGGRKESRIEWQSFKSFL